MMKSLYSEIFLTCFLKDHQHYVPHNRTDSLQVWYMLLSVFKVKFLSLETVFFKAPKAWDAFVICHSISTSIPNQKQLSRYPRYGNPSTQHKSPPSSNIDSLSFSIAIHLFGLGVLRVSLKSLQVFLYSLTEFHSSL